MLRAKWLLVIVIILIPVFTIISLLHINSYTNPKTSDFFVAWLGALMVRSGQNPYSGAQWTAAFTTYQVFDTTYFGYPYPPHLAIVIAPLTMMSFEQAFILWMTLLQMAILAALLILISLWNIPVAKHYILPLGLSAIIYRPTWLIVGNGQFGGIFLFILVVTIWSFEHNHWLIGGIFIAFLAFKTTFSLPILLLASLWLLASRRWWALVGISLIAITLTIIDLPLLSDWISSFIINDAALLNANVGRSLTIWGVSSNMCGFNNLCTNSVAISGTALLMAGTTIFLCYRRRKIRPLAAMSLIVPVALMVVPYMWTYDQIMLIIPITFIVLRTIEFEYPYIVSALFFFVMAVFAILLLVLADQIGIDVWSVLLSAITFVLVIWFMRDPPPKEKNLSPIASSP